MLDYLINIWLGFKFRFLKNISKKTDFGNPNFVENFNSPGFIVSDHNLYSTEMISLNANVEVINGKLLLHVRYENKEFSSWWGTKRKLWSFGSVDYKNRAFSYGIWSVRCKLPNDPDAWPAIWLLRERHPEPETKIDLGMGQKVSDHEAVVSGWISQRVELNWYVWHGEKIIGFVSALEKASQKITVDSPLPDLQGQNIFVSPDHIIPEVDIMEIIRGKIQQTVHFGYSNVDYKLREWNVKRGNPNFNHEYEFSVELTKTRYKFYIDRILTGVLTKKAAFSDAKAYLIINNAKQEGILSGDNSVFEISEIKFYPR